MFLEEYPLYKKFDLGGKFPKEIKDIPRVKVNFHCKKCGSIQTFVMKNYWFDACASNDPSAGQVLRADYECASCNVEHVYFMIKFDENEEKVMKVGQYPPWSIKIEKGLEKILDKHVDTYKKAIICESQGFGIGAYSYYRRIVEEIIDELLKLISDAIEDEVEKENYEKALNQIDISHNASKKIDIVKGLLPSTLQPEKNNPLTILHSNLSEGLHTLSDEECLTKAGYIRVSLVFLVEQVIEHREKAKNYTESLKKLSKIS